MKRQMQRLVLPASAALCLSVVAAAPERPTDDVRLHFAIDHVAWILDQERVL
jgi:hypothetical protein